MLDIFIFMQMQIFYVSTQERNRSEGFSFPCHVQGVENYIFFQFIKNYKTKIKRKFIKSKFFSKVFSSFHPFTAYCIKLQNFVYRINFLSLWRSLKAFAVLDNNMLYFILLMIILSGKFLSMKNNFLVDCNKFNANAIYSHLPAKKERKSHYVYHKTKDRSEGEKE